LVSTAVSVRLSDGFTPTNKILLHALGVDAFIKKTKIDLSNNLTPRIKEFNMKNLKQGLLIAAIALSQPIWSCTEDGKEGFLPENNFKISVNAKRLGGLSEQQFNDVITKVETIYAPIVTQEGGKLVVERKWTDATVNAYAQRAGSDWKVSMFGGLARHETITEDGFALVVCHEIGHHIGGAPKKVSMWSNPWASNEGQADYFATLKCLRRSFLNDDNASIVAAMNVPKTVTDTCNKAWTNADDRAICVRGAMAGDSVAKLFAALRNQAPSKFETPDARIVTTTDDNHPATQCRLDTYFQGALCEVDFNENVNQTSEVAGTCHGTLGHTVGLRPLCWFKPKAR
jgi:hypothetical protein